MSNPTSEQYTVGEIALFNRPDSRFNGMEVTIVKPLRLVKVRDQRTGLDSKQYVYVIDGEFGPKRPGVRFWAAPPEFLRKRRPPQDWVKICNLVSAPTERVEEFA